MKIQVQKEATEVENCRLYSNQIDVDGMQSVKRGSNGGGGGGGVSYLNKPSCYSRLDLRRERGASPTEHRGL